MGREERIEFQGSREAFTEKAVFEQRLEGRVSHVDMRGKSIQEEEITKGPKAAMPCIQGS